MGMLGSGREEELCARQRWGVWAAARWPVWLEGLTPVSSMSSQDLDGGWVGGGALLGLGVMAAGPVAPGPAAFCGER